MRIVSASSSISILRRQIASEVSYPSPPEGQRGALIAVEAPRRSERAPQSVGRPSAAFVAHLLATRLQTPQTRTHRRAEPEEAIAVYRSMTKPVMGRRAFGTRV